MRYKKSHGKSRFSIAVSKKVARKASERNTIKRRAYEAIATHVPNLRNVQGILYAQPNIKNASFDEITKDVAQLVQNLEEKSA